MKRNVSKMMVQIIFARPENGKSRRGSTIHANALLEKALKSILCGQVDITEIFGVNRVGASNVESLQI